MGVSSNRRARLRRFLCCPLKTTSTKGTLKTRHPPIGCPQKAMGHGLVATNFLSRCTLKERCLPMVSTTQPVPGLGGYSHTRKAHQKWCKVLWLVRIPYVPFPWLGGVNQFSPEFGADKNHLNAMKSDSKVHPMLDLNSALWLHVFARAQVEPRWFKACSGGCFSFCV